MSHVTNCNHCGSPLSAADLNQPNCRYCGALHPHMARAAEKVEVVKQLLAPSANGMPMAMAAMMGHHTAPGQPHAHGYGAPPPGAPGAAVPPLGGAPMQIYGQSFQQVHVFPQVQQAQKRARLIVGLTITMILLMTALGVGVAVLSSVLGH